MRSPTLLIGACLVVAGVGFSVFQLFSAKMGFELEPQNRALVLMGEQIYAVNCAACHGKNLEGQANWKSPGPDGKMPAPPHDHTGHTWHHADKLLFEITKYGVKKFAGENYESNMPAYEGTLSDREIVASLTYIKSRWPEAIRKRHDEINERTHGQAQ